MKRHESWSDFHKLYHSEEHAAKTQNGNPSNTSSNLLKVLQSTISRDDPPSKVERRGSLVRNYSLKSLRKTVSQSMFSGSDAGFSGDRRPCLARGDSLKEMRKASSSRKIVADSHHTSDRRPCLVRGSSLRDMRRNSLRDMRRSSSRRVIGVDDSYGITIVDRRPCPASGDSLRDLKRASAHGNGPMQRGVPRSKSSIGLVRQQRSSPTLTRSKSNLIENYSTSDMTNEYGQNASWTNRMKSLDGVRA